MPALAGLSLPPVPSRPGVELGGEGQRELLDKVRTKWKMHLGSPSEGTVLFVLSPSLHQRRLAPGRSLWRGPYRTLCIAVFSSVPGIYPAGAGTPSPPLRPSTDGEECLQILPTVP